VLQSSMMNFLIKIDGIYCILNFLNDLAYLRNERDESETIRVQRSMRFAAFVFLRFTQSQSKIENEENC